MPRVSLFQMAGRMLTSMLTNFTFQVSEHRRLSARRSAGAGPRGTGSATRRAGLSLARRRRTESRSALRPLSSCDRLLCRAAAPESSCFLPRRTCHGAGAGAGARVSRSPGSRVRFKFQGTIDRNCQWQQSKLHDLQSGVPVNRLLVACSLARAPSTGRRFGPPVRSQPRRSQASEPSESPARPGVRVTPGPRSSSSSAFARSGAPDKVASLAITF